MPELAKIWFTTGLSSPETEGMWAKPQADATYVVDNIPVFVRGVSLGDEVTATSVDGLLSFESVSVVGGHSTIQLVRRPDVPDGAIQRLIHGLIDLGCGIEQGGPKHHGVDVPPETDTAKLNLVLEQAYMDEHIWYEVVAGPLMSTDAWS